MKNQFTYLLLTFLLPFTAFTQNKFSVGIFTGIKIQLGEKAILGIEPNIKYTPNDFSLILYASPAKTAVEARLTVSVRMK